MEKPFDYDNVEAKNPKGGNFDTPKAGPCVFGIIEVEEAKTKSGDRKVIFHLDIKEGEYKNYYSEMIERTGGKGTYLQYHQSIEGKGLPYFKGIVKCIEESNNGFKFDAQKFDEKTLTRKYIGGMLQEKPYINKRGEKASGVKVYFLCSVAEAKSGTLITPEPLPLEQKSEDDLPF